VNDSTGNDSGTDSVEDTFNSDGDSTYKDEGINISER